MNNICTTYQSIYNNKPRQFSFSSVHQLPLLASEDIRRGYWPAAMPPLIGNWPGHQQNLLVAGSLREQRWESDGMRERCKAEPLAAKHVPRHPPAGTDCPGVCGAAEVTESFCANRLSKRPTRSQQDRTYKPKKSCLLDCINVWLYHLQRLLPVFKTHGWSGKCWDV